MRIEQARKLLHKKIKVVLLSGHNYSGTINSIFDDCFIMTDKYSEDVMIFYNSVSVISGVDLPC